MCVWIYVSVLCNVLCAAWLDFYCFAHASFSRKYVCLLFSYFVFYAFIPQGTGVDCFWMQKVMVPRSNSACYFSFLKKYPREPVKSANICWDYVQKPSQLVCFRLLFSLNFNLYVVKGCAIFSLSLSLSLKLCKKIYTKMAWLTTSADLHQCTLELTGIGFVCFLVSTDVGAIFPIRRK